MSLSAHPLAAAAAVTAGGLTALSFRNQRLAGGLVFHAFGLGALGTVLAAAVYPKAVPYAAGLCLGGVAGFYCIGIAAKAAR